MLVLSRKQGESIVVGTAIRVTVIELRGGRVRLGIEAPAHVNVRRQELQADAIQTAPLRVQPSAAASRSTAAAT